MLSWLTRKKFFSSKRRREEKPKIPMKNRVSSLSRWHLACQWLAHAVDGVDMILESSGSIFVVSKVGSGYDGHIVVSKSVVGSRMRCHLAVNMTGIEAFECKAIDEWSEELAKLVASLIALKEPEPNLDSPESMWGIWAYGQEMLFPHFKNEEELFMRMELDGFVCNDEREGDSGAQS